MNIILTSNGDGYRACLAEDHAIWAAGKTSDAAIGDLVRIHPEVFGVHAIVRTEEFNSLVAILGDVLKTAFSIFRTDEDWKGRTGAYFCVADVATGIPLFPPILIGSVPPEKDERYQTLCKEKAKRLAAHPEHEASWESRNPDADLWSGAVRVNDLIFSMSGLPELGDEASVLVGAEVYYQENLGSIATATHVAARSNNPYWKPLRGYLSRWL